MTGYLDQLTEHHPDLLDHVARGGGGGLLERLQLRALLTAGAPSSQLPQPAPATG